MSSEFKMIYKGPKFDIPQINVKPYFDGFFQLELDLESDVFYEIRKTNNIVPFRINESSKSALKEIKAFFNKNKDTFYFYFIDKELVGSILNIGNFIQCLSVAEKYQHKGYGTLLTKYTINKILENGFKQVELKVLSNNQNATNMYAKLGFGIAY
jgi:ribosomal protein S18 acetylase RimI-like enzyme